ncbi:MAG: 50S ribosomal protein L21e [Candidatus Thalassarchaeaceae archaeon]|jgi:large subunit ribosomal protein L21e|nr:50S ribosomal protein L21e [Candidatus Thalassarchaeaceae archaeon]
MRRTHGLRQGTRSIASRSKKDRGRLFISRAIHPYKIGDSVAIVIDGGQQKGMPHRRFQGRTGTISGKQGRAYVITVKDGNMTKTVVSRPEHLRPQSEVRK